MSSPVSNAMNYSFTGILTSHPEQLSLAIPHW